MGRRRRELGEEEGVESNEKESRYAGQGGDRLFMKSDFLLEGGEKKGRCENSLA